MDIFESIAQVKTLQTINNVIIRQYYKGNPIQPDFLKSNPDLIHLFPSNDEVFEVFLKIKAQANRYNTRWEIIVSENGIQSELI